MGEKHHWYDPKKRRKYQREWYERRKQIAKEEERNLCYVPHPRRNLLRQVKLWIDIGGIDYARRTLSESGLDAPSIDRIIEAMNFAGIATV